jgi:hypothetical protein
MPRSFLATAVAVALLLGADSLRAQDWNAPDAMALVERALARRAERLADTSLRDYAARAHGFVFFLAQLGEGLSEPPRLVKSDQLALEVYWRAPSSSKQRIIGWRDRVDLPTDIQYHRDHLGIVQNNFADRIRLGQGDEVRDVPHPLGPSGPTLYDYALEAPITLRLPARAVRVHEVVVRPRQFDEPRVIGSLYIDVETAELVVFRFNFTRVAYLDDTLEDITIVLENGLFEGRYWLPRRQEVEIRRRTAWLDLPARGIIRGRWEIDTYRINDGLPRSLFLGPEIVAAPEEEREQFAWDEPLAEAVERATGPVTTFDLEEVREEIGAVAGARVLSGLATARPSVGALSDLAHVNRVEGLALGAGGVVRPGGGPFEARMVGSYGFADKRAKLRVDLRFDTGRWTLGLHGARAVEDIGDETVISPLLNSILAQEGGKDFGDYVLAERIVGRIGYVLGARGRLSVWGGVERTGSVPTVATPLSGTYRPNPALGSGRWWTGGLTLERRSPELALGLGWNGRIDVEGGTASGRQYVRLRGDARVQVPVGATAVVVRGSAGWGSVDLPPHRSFVWGGRGTVVGEPFRAWGGRSRVVGSVEWRVAVPFPAIPLGPFASTGRQLTVAPFVAAGWTGGAAVAGLPWQPSGGMRPAVGVGLEWFHGLLRVDLGVRLRDPALGVVVDVRRDLWGIL